MIAPFPILRPRYRVERLGALDAARVQPLFEACADYTLLETGEPPPPNAAALELEATPPGRTTDDKFALGLLTGEDRIVGLLAADRGWPDEGCWWIGLLLIAPDCRGTGLARDFVDRFLAWVTGQGARGVELAVFDENRRADQFWRGLGFSHVRSTEPRAIGNKTHVLHVMRRELAD